MSMLLLKNSTGGFRSHIKLCAFLVISTLLKEKKKETIGGSDLAMLEAE